MSNVSLEERALLLVLIGYHPIMSFDNEILAYKDKFDDLYIIDQDGTEARVTFGGICGPVIFTQRIIVLNGKSTIRLKLTGVYNITVFDHFSGDICLEYGYIMIKENGGN